MTLSATEAVFVKMKLLFHDQRVLASIDFQRAETLRLLNAECGPIRNLFE